MAGSWLDWLEAIVVMSLFFGVVGGFAYATGAVDVSKQNEELKKKGVILNESSLTIKGEGRAIGQEDLADSMQRSMAKTAASGALKFRSGAGTDGPPAPAAAKGKSPKQPKTPA